MNIKNNIINCVCGIPINKKYKNLHLLSKKHKRLINDIIKYQLNNPIDTLYKS
jgi:hypothetical protein